jgi:hypothetical protein
VPSLTVNAQGQITAASNVTISGVAPAGAASGDLSGTYPSPTVAKIQGVAVNSQTPLDGQYLKYTVTGTNYVPVYVSFTDLKSSAGLTQIPSTCTSSQTLAYQSPSDTFACVSIAIADSAITYGSKSANTFLAAPNGSAGAPSFRSIATADLGSGTASTSTYLRGDGSWAIVPAAGSSGQIQFNSAGAFAASSHLFWDNTNSRLGIGTTTPAQAFSVYSSTSPALSLIDGTQGAGKVLTSDASGNASWGVPAGSSTLVTTATTSNVNYYPLFVASASGGTQAANLGSGLTFNPSTNTLSTTTFVGALTGHASSDLSLSGGTLNGTLNMNSNNIVNVNSISANTFSGNATSAPTAQTAANADNIFTTSTSSNASYYPLFASSSATSFQSVDVGTGLSFNPSTNTLSTTNFVGALTGAVTGHASSDLALSGGTMSGGLAMGGNNITGVGTISASAVSATTMAATTFTGALTGHASSDLALSGGTMTGSVAMGGNNITGAGTISATTFSGNATTATTATNANNVNTTATSSNASYYPLFVSSSSNGNQAVDLGTGLTFNPATNNLSTTTFTGALTGHASSDLALSGGTMTGSVAMGGNNITGAGTISATNINATSLTGALTGHASSDLALSGGTMTGSVAMGGNNITGAGTISATTFSGSFSGNATTATTATNANNVNTTATSSNASYYPLFVSSSSNGNQAVDLGTGLTFNPATNTLTTTNFAGSFSGALSGHASSDLALSGGTMTGSIAMGGNSISGGGTISATTFSGSLSGNASSATSATYVHNDNTNSMAFHWSGQSGQPTWLWGSNDGVNNYVWNPSNFSVNYANSAGSATTATALSSTGDNVYTSGWYRSNGSVGWYNNTWGGGLWMEDSSWIRTYGSKNFYVQGGSLAVDYNLGVGVTSPQATADINGDLLVRTNSSNISTQGGYMMWDYCVTNSTGCNGLFGETDFVNNRGIGNGGFAFYDATSGGSFGSPVSIIAPTGSYIMSNVGIGTTATNYKIEVTEASSTSNSPATIGFADDGGTSEYSQFVLDHGDSWQTGFGMRSQIASFWGLEIHGQTMSSTGPSFVAGGTGEAALTVFGPGGTESGAPVLNVVSNDGTSNWMTVLANGNVGIGNTSPGSPLDIAGPNISAVNSVISSNSFQIHNASNYLYFGVDSTNSNSYIQSDIGLGGPQVLLLNARGGNVGIGTNVAGYKLSVNGDVNMTSSHALRFGGTSVCTSSGCTSSSDRTLKEHIGPLQNSLDKVLKLQGVEYDYKDKTKFTDKHQIGVIAQDVEKVYPEVVIQDSKTGLRSVAYDHLVAPLIEAVKELHQKLNELTDSVTKVSAEQTKQARDIASVQAENEKLKIENQDKTKQLEAMKTYLCSKDPSATICK